MFSYQHHLAVDPNAALDQIKVRKTQIKPIDSVNVTEFSIFSELTNKSGASLSASAELVAPKASHLILTTDCGSISVVGSCGDLFATNRVGAIKIQVVLCNEASPLSDRDETELRRYAMNNKIVIYKNHVVLDGLSYGVFQKGDRISIDSNLNLKITN